MKRITMLSFAKKDVWFIIVTIGHWTRASFFIL